MATSERRRASRRLLLLVTVVASLTVLPLAGGKKTGGGGSSKAKDKAGKASVAVASVPHEKLVEQVYAWWCMFSATTRPDSVLCKEWVHDHKLREPKQYIEGRESFHLVAETDEMYRAWCAEHRSLVGSGVVCDSLRGDRPAPPAHALQSLGVAGAPGYSALHAEAESPFLSPGAPRENGNRDATHDVTRDGDARPHPSSLEAYAAASGRAAHWEDKGGRVVEASKLAHCPSSVSAPTATRAKVRLVLLVGVEGSGHHLVASIVQKAHQQHVHLKEWAPEVWLSESGTSGGASGRSSRVKRPETSARVLAQRIRKDPELREVLARSAFSPVKTIVFVADSFPEGVEHSTNHHPDLVAFANLKFHGFDPVLLFLRRHLALATLSAKRRFPRSDIATELVTTEALAVRIEAYYQHLCRPPASALSVAAAGAARAAANRTMSRTGGGRGGSDDGGGGGGGASVAAAEAFAKQGWQTDDGALTGIGGGSSENACPCYRVDYGDLCGGRAKAYMELAWALCIPSLDLLTVFHRCADRSKDYAPADLSLSRRFFEGKRGGMYPHVNDPSALV